MEFPKIIQEKPAMQIVNSIWNMIMTGQLKPGDKLPPEHKLVKHYDVSLGTLREALNTLEAYGHILKKRGASGGSIIQGISSAKGIDLLGKYLDKKDSTLNDIKQTSLMLYPECASIIATDLTDETKKQIETILTDMKEELDQFSGSMKGFDFGTILCNLTGNHMYCVIGDLVLNRLMGIKKELGIFDSGSSSDTYSYLQAQYIIMMKISEAIFTKDPTIARNEMVTNLNDYFDMMSTKLNIK